MPLPDAEDPQTSNLYAQLRTSQLDSVTQDNFDKVKDPLYINAEWEDEARRLMLWGVLSGKVSTSGPMPGTYKIVAVSGLSSNTFVDLFTPAAGEIWEVVDCSYTNTGGGTASYFVQLKDISNDETVTLQDRLNTSEGDAQFDDFPASGVYHTAEVRFQMKYLQVSGTNTITAKAAFIRVR